MTGRIGDSTNRPATNNEPPTFADAEAERSVGQGTAAGFLDNLVLEADDRRILVKGRTSKDMVLVEDAPEKEVHREKLTTTVVALDLDDGQIEDIAA